MEAPNRVVFGAHFTQFTEPSPMWGEPGFYGDRLARYLELRAAGGAGVVIAGQAQVHPTTAYQMPNNAIAWDPAAVPGFRVVTSAVHRHGALAFLQLAHNGGVNRGDWSKLPVWSAGGYPNHFEAPTVIERDEIAAVVAGFARSAANAAEAGFDGIEVHGAHGYLIHEFLSPRSNHRDDEYGGSIENRMRFATEVLTAVRAAVGSDLAVGLRLVGDEEQGRRGLTPADCAELAARFEALGLVDFLNVSIGLSGMGMVRPVYAPHLLGVPAARIVKEAVGRTPVFAVHRILTPDEAESVLAEGSADAITVVRALIADAGWAAKARRGAPAEIRPCTGCNQGCYGHLTQGLPITCVTDPVVGRETALAGRATGPVAAHRKRVVVAGGGPGGLEAAWVAAARGHDVVLLERSDALGGKIRLAAQLPGRTELAGFATWRAAECSRRGVDVRLRTPATAASVLALSPDAVIVATGGVAVTDAPVKWHPMPVPGSDQPFVMDHEEAVARPDRVGDRVVVVDLVGHIEAIGLGELLAETGREVTVATPLSHPMLLDSETMAAALPRAARAGTRWRPNTAMVSIGDHEVTLIDVLSMTMETIDVDTVVIRTHGRPSAALYDQLRGQVAEVVKVGDAVAVRTADRAIYDGHVAALAL